MKENSMKEKYTSELVVGQKYDFKVHQDYRPVCRNATLIYITTKRGGWGQLIWNGQLYDIPLFLIRSKWKKQRNDPKRK